MSAVFGFEEMNAPNSVVRWADGRPYWEHVCTARGWRTQSVRLDERWSWDSAANTVSPSLHCLTCRTHGFWTQGVWYPFVEADTTEKVL